MRERRKRGVAVKDLIPPAIAAIIAGIFAIVTWKLKEASDERARLAALDKKRRDDISPIYTGILALFEQAINQLGGRGSFTLRREFADADAKIKLLASPENAAQYEEACSLLWKWSRLEDEANAEHDRLKVAEQNDEAFETEADQLEITAGLQAAILLISRDRNRQTWRRRVKEASREYQKLQNKLQELGALMRTELDSSDIRT
jgi:hypothetical protein